MNEARRDWILDNRRNITLGVALLGAVLGAISLDSLIASHDHNDVMLEAFHFGVSALAGGLVGAALVGIPISILNRKFQQELDDLYSSDPPGM